MTPQILEQIGAVMGAVFTLMVFSYLLGDNFLYRLAIQVFVGVAAAFVLIAAVESVIIPWLNLTVLAQPPEPTRIAMGLIPFMLTVMIIFKGSPRLVGLGNLGLAVVVGVGVALALSGAINGTLVPFVLVTIRAFRPENAINGFIMLVGTISVLVYFTYSGVRRPSGEITQLLPVRFVGLLGQGVIAVTLGATYALLILSALAVLTGVIAERLLVFLP